MFTVRGSHKWSLAMLVTLAIIAGSLVTGQDGRQPHVQAASCWRAEITEQRTDLDLAGSVLRVSVQGKAGLPVVVRSKGDFETVGFTGTKPEYGAFVAEFAPLSKGTYFIEPQGLGLVFELWLDGKNYTRVNFTPVSCPPTPTPTPRPPTATPRPRATATRRPAFAYTPSSVATQQAQAAADWQGRVAQHIQKLEGSYWATIAVRVIGRPAGQQVELRSGGWSTSCTTGTKPEHGADACEFGALNSGTYRLTPRDLGTQLDVAVELGDFVLVEFYYTGPKPQTRWVGSVAQNTSGSEPTEHFNSAITVVVAGKPWYEVEIRAYSWSTTCITGYKPEYGPDACEFGGLRASTYTITPKDLGTSVQVTMDGWGWALVRFDQISVSAPRSAKPTATPVEARATSTPSLQPTKALAPGPSVTPKASPTTAVRGWQGRVVSNTSGQQEGTGVWSVIIVRVINRPGVRVTLTGGGAWSTTCLTGTKPEYGPDACEFGGLWPATYYLQPEGADIRLEVEMDGLGTAFVEFAPP